MSKTTKNMLITVVIIILVFTLIVLGYQHFKSEPMENIDKENVSLDANKGLENMLNEILDNNELETNNILNEENTQVSAKISTNDNENTMTPKENKAINLVKDKWIIDWGSLDDVSFNVSIQSDGKYLVMVYDTITTHLIKGYVVDVNTETVTEK